MPISLYQLNGDGTIPTTVPNGGYYPTPSGDPWPRDWTYLGVTTDPSGFTDIPTLAALKTYLTSISTGWVDIEGNPFDVDYNATWLWEQQ